MLRKLVFAATTAALVLGFAPMTMTAANALPCTSGGSNNASATCSSDANVAFVVASTGSRVLSNTSVLTGLTNSGGAVTLQGTWTASVVETAIAGCCTGPNPWKVTAQLIDANNSLALNQISSGNTPTGYVITGSHFTVQNSATPSITLGAAGVTATSGSGTDQDMSAERTLFNVNGENTANLYGTPATTYTDTGSLTLAPASGTPTGTYSGTFRETLYN